MTSLGKSWIDDVGEVIASIIPKYSNIDLGSASRPFRNIYLSGDTIIGDDITVTGTVTAGNYNLTDGSDKNYSLDVYAAGTAYSLTDTSAALDFGTTDPSIVLDKAGTYLLIANVNLLYNAATFAASETVTLKLRRTNNTAADVANSSLVLATDIITTLTYTFGAVSLPAVFYTTTNVDDAITIFGDVSTAPGAGSLDATAASIIAIRLTNP